MISPGVVATQLDTDPELYIVVLSNSIHLSAGTGRLITCPFIPGHPPDDAMAMVIAVTEPAGVVLPELVQWHPTSAVGDPIGNIGTAALQETTTLVAALMR